MPQLVPSFRRADFWIAIFIVTSFFIFLLFPRLWAHLPGHFGQKIFSLIFRGDLLISKLLDVALMSIQSQIR